jgi:hypothetical protein
MIIRRARSSFADWFTSAAASRARRANAIRNICGAFPPDAGAARVRQRIAGTAARVAVTPRVERRQGRRPLAPTMSGSFSQFYSRDESRNRFIDARRPIPGRRSIGGSTSTNCCRPSTSAPRRPTAAPASARASGSYTNDFRPVTLVGSSRSAGDDTARIYELYVDARDEPSGLSGRIGRQSLFGSGVFGRFDGVRLGWQASPAVEVHAQAGFPVSSTRTDRLIRDRWFYGFSVGYAPPDANYGLTAYWYDQRSHGLVDRRAIGLEGRYTTKGIALFGWPMSMSSSASSAIFSSARRCRWPAGRAFRSRPTSNIIRLCP